MLNKFTIILSAATIVASVNISYASNFNYKKLEERITALESKNSNISISAFKTAKLSGRLQIDANFYDEQNGLDDKNDGISIKRARLGIKGEIKDGFKYKFESDFAKNKVSIKDAHISYGNFNNINLKIGQFKPAFSLEQLISSKNITFLNRSVAIDDIAPDRKVGAQLSHYFDNGQISLGTFGRSVKATADTANNDSDSSHALNTRITYALLNDNESLLHVGYALQSATQDDTLSNTSTSISQGYEIIARYKSFQLQSEYIIRDVNNYNNNANNIELNSHYIQASAFLTGEQRKYKSKSGVINNVKVSNPVGDGSMGAWEIATRYSNVNNDDKAIITNGETTDITYGVNWYLNDNIRIMANYKSSKTINANSTNDNVKYNTYSLRTQIFF